MDSVEVVRAMYEAFNAQDWDRFGTYVAEDVEWTNIALETTSNLKQLRTGYPAFFEAFPDVHVRIVNIFGDGPYVVVEWHARGTHTGPLRGEPPTGKVFERRGCSVAEIQNGKIVRYRDYFDRASQLRQLGLMHFGLTAPADPASRCDVRNDFAISQIVDRKELAKLPGEV